jgi:hypothetical protein
MSMNICYINSLRTEVLTVDIKGTVLINSKMNDGARMSWRMLPWKHKWINYMILKDLKMGQGSGSIWWGGLQCK